MVDKEHVIALCKEMVSRGVKTPWVCQCGQDLAAIESEIDVGRIRFGKVEYRLARSALAFKEMGKFMKGMQGLKGMPRLGRGVT